MNNHTQVKRITDKVGAVLVLENAILPVVQEYAAPAAELIVQVDGGHIPNNERKRANKTYTSLVAESHIDSLINTRHKRTKKMQ